MGIVALGPQDFTNPRTFTIKAHSLELSSLLLFDQNKTAKELSQGVLGLRDQIVSAKDLVTFLQGEVTLPVPERGALVTDVSLALGR